MIDRRALDLAVAISEATGRGGAEWFDHEALSRQRIKLKDRGPLNSGELECEKCGARFRPQTKSHILYCSRKCDGAARRKRRRPKHTCPVCWKDFAVPSIKGKGSWRRRNGARATCSERCRYELIQRKRRVSYAPRPMCSKGHQTVYVAKARRRICPTCRKAYMRASNDRKLAARRARGLRRPLAWCRDGARRMTPAEESTLAALSNEWAPRSQLLVVLRDVKPTALSQRLTRLVARGLAERHHERGRPIKWRRSSQPCA